MCVKAVNVSGGGMWEASRDAPLEGRGGDNTSAVVEQHDIAATRAPASIEKDRSLRNPADHTLRELSPTSAVRRAVTQPPVTKTTLSELDVNKIVNNPRLRHDINFDPELHFRPNIDMEKGRRKSYRARMYWENMTRQLASFMTPSQEFDTDNETEWAVPATVRAIREILETLLPQRDRLSVEETFGIELLMQQFRHGRMSKLSTCRSQSPLQQCYFDILLERLGGSTETRDDLGYQTAVRATIRRLGEAKRLECLDVSGALLPGPGCQINKQHLNFDHGRQEWSKRNLIGAGRYDEALGPHVDCIGHAHGRILRLHQCATKLSRGHDKSFAKRRVGPRGPRRSLIHTVVIGTALLSHLCIATTNDDPDERRGIASHASPGSGHSFQSSASTSSLTSIFNGYPQVTGSPPYKKQDITFEQNQSDLYNLLFHLTCTIMLSGLVYLIHQYICMYPFYRKLSPMQQRVRCFSGLFLFHSLYIFTHSAPRALWGVSYGLWLSSAYFAGYSIYLGMSRRHVRLMYILTAIVLIPIVFIALNSLIITAEPKLGSSTIVTPSVVVAFLFCEGYVRCAEAMSYYSASQEDASLPYHHENDATTTARQQDNRASLWRLWRRDSQSTVDERQRNGITTNTQSQPNTRDGPLPHPELFSVSESDSSSRRLGAS